MKNRTIFVVCISLSLLGKQKIIAQSDTFHYVSDTVQTWTVPGCVTQITVQLWAGGGGGDNENGYSLFELSGGSGAYYKGVLSGLSQGTILNLYVPSGGKYSGNLTDGGIGGWPGGGKGGNDSIISLEGGGGGGYAAIQINGTYYVVAGAGGGAGGSPTPPYHYGGSGGAPNGGNGGNEAYYGGFGGTISSGGKPGYSRVICDSGTSGAAFTGGMGGGKPPPCDFLYGGGGGGGGYYGGGGGGDAGEGGGGGSSYPASSFTSGGITFTPISNLQGNVDSSTYDALAPGSPPDSTIGMGGFDTNGGNGLIIIYTGIAKLKDTITVKTQPNCGICNGSIVATASGGSGAYTYSWSPTGQTTAMATGLCANTYTVTVSDSCGDVSTASVILTAIPITVIASVAQEVKCNGNCNGSATATVGLATPPYTYKWAPNGGTKATATGLCAGGYTVTVTDKNGCTGTASVTITQPTLLKDSIVNVTNILCNGANTGSVTATASGGVLPYTYKWAPSGGSKATATGLSAGTYTLTVTDSNACTATITATITQPTQVKTGITINNVLCNGGVGSATVTASGGVSPYTYLWSPTNQSTATATGLNAGAYTIKVSDNNGCTLTNTVTITQPAVLGVTTTNTHAYCNLPNGTATANPTGGTGPYTYVWSPGKQNTATATGLLAGSYTVSVTDNHNCTASASVTITQPTLVTATISSVNNVSCYNGANGSATVTGSGGTAPYTYLWTPSSQTTATATGLFALSYTATVTDNNGCTATASINLTEPTQVTAAISEPKIICKDSTGILIANASGGTPPYQYSWSSGATTGIATITPIATNIYSVMVTDSHGCTASATIALQYGPAFAVDITGKRNVCVGDSTTICANAIGAIDGVFYEWAPTNNTNGCIEISPTLTNVYTVTVVDGCGSTTTAQTSITSEPSPVIDFGVNFSQGCEPFCVQFNNNTTLTKGQVGEYVWDFGNGDSSKSKSPIYCYKTAGQYNVSLTVISDSGCSATLTKVNMLSIYAPPKAAFTYSPQPVSILSPTVQFQDKSMDPNGNNGRIIYWIWDFGDRSDSSSNIENPIHTYQDTGTYCINLSVMSREGCTDTTTNCLIVEPDFTLYIPSAFTPNGDGLNEAFKPVGQYVKTFEMYIFNRWGEQIFHTTDLTNGWNGEVNGTGQISPEDVYIYKIMVTDAENHTHSYVGNVTLLK